MSNWVRKIKKGFTLIELLVVIAIIAILAAILVPAVNKALVEGRLTTMINNGRNIYLSLKSDELSNVLGGLPPWPTRGGLNVDNRTFPNSTVFFAWVVTNGLLNVDFSFFSAPGMSSITTTRAEDFITGEAGANSVNAWCVLSSVNSSTKDTAPVLFTRNVSTAAGGVLPNANTAGAILNPNGVPFGDKGGALVLMGGSAMKLSKGFTTNQFNSAGATNVVMYPD